MVGTVIAGWNGWRGEISRLAVAPGHRRRGVGTALVDAAHDRLRRLGGRRVTALVVAAEDAAVGFWSHSGYHRDERIVRFVTTLH